MPITSTLRHASPRARERLELVVREHGFADVSSAVEPRARIHDMDRLLVSIQTDEFLAMAGLAESIGLRKSAFVRMAVRILMRRCRELAVLQPDIPERESWSEIMARSERERALKGGA